MALSLRRWGAFMGLWNFGNVAKFRRSPDGDTQRCERLDLSSTAPMVRHSVSFDGPMRRATNARRSRSVSKSHDTPYLTAKCARSDLSPRTKRKAMSGYFKAKSAGRRQIWSGARLRAAVPPAEPLIPDFATLPRMIANWSTVEDAKHLPPPLLRSSALRRRRFR